MDPNGRINMLNIRTIKENYHQQHHGQYSMNILNSRTIKENYSANNTTTITRLGHPRQQQQQSRLHIQQHDNLAHHGQQLAAEELPWLYIHCDLQAEVKKKVVLTFLFTLSISVICRFSFPFLCALYGTHLVHLANTETYPVFLDEVHLTVSWR